MQPNEQKTISGGEVVVLTENAVDYVDMSREQLLAILEDIGANEKINDLSNEKLLELLRDGENEKYNEYFC